MRQMPKNCQSGVQAAGGANPAAPFPEFNEPRRP